MPGVPIALEPLIPAKFWNLLSFQFWGKCGQRNRRNAAEGQRATSTKAILREFSWVVAQTEVCAGGLRSDEITNATETNLA